VRVMGALNEQERAVTTFYYYGGLTLREIGGALILTEGHISQILRQAPCVSAGRSPMTSVSPRGPSPSFGILEAWTPLC
jgi:hypothetical protein